MTRTVFWYIVREKSILRISFSNKKKLFRNRSLCHKQCTFNEKDVIATYIQNEAQSKLSCGWQAEDNRNKIEGIEIVI